MFEEQFSVFAMMLRSQPFGAGRKKITYLYKELSYGLLESLIHCGDLISNGAGEGFIPISASASQSRCRHHIGNLRPNFPPKVQTDGSL